MLFRRRPGYIGLLGNNLAGKGAKSAFLQSGRDELPDLGCDLLTIYDPSLAIQRLTGDADCVNTLFDDPKA